MAEEVGFEDNRTYYDRISKELRQKHKQPEEMKEEIREYVTL